VSASPSAPRPAAHGLFEINADGTIRLIGGYSPSSGRYHFPLLPICPYTGADDVERVLLSTTGTLWGWTAVRVAPPGYRGEVPYGFGVVELTEETLRVVTRLAESDPERLEYGMPMELVAETVFTDDGGAPVVTWCFGVSGTRYSERIDAKTTDGGS
jgi:uncharacterized OB-fold protein